MKIASSISPHDEEGNQVYWAYIKKNLNLFKLEEISSILYTLAYIYIVSERELINELFHQVLQKKDQKMKPAGVGLLAWSASVLEYSNKDFWSRLYEELVKLNPEKLDIASGRNYLQGLHTLKNQKILDNEIEKSKKIEEKFLEFSKFL